MRRMAYGDTVMLSGLDIGPCVKQWSADYLAEHDTAHQQQVSVHVCPPTVDLDEVN